MRKILFQIFALVLFYGSALGSSYTVCDSGHGCNYTTIASAVGAMTTGQANIITVQSPYSANEDVTISKSGSGVGSELVITGTSGFKPSLKGFTVSGNYVTVSYFTVNGQARGSNDWAFNISGSYINILNNSITANASRTGEIGCGIDSRWYTTPSHCLIQGNILTSNIDLGGGDHPAIQLSGSYNSAISNEISGQDFDGFWVFGHDQLIQKNYIHDFATSGSGGHQDLIQSFGDNGEYAYNITIDGNRFISAQMQGITLSEDGQVSGNTTNRHDVKITNNIFVGIGWHNNLGMHSMTVANNLWYNCGGVGDGQVVSGVEITADHSDYCAHDSVFYNNVYVNPPGVVSYGANDGTTFDYDYTTTITSWTDGDLNVSETHGVQNGGDPKFVDITDYRYQATSPLIGAGINLYSTFTVDRDGNARRSSGAWDMGPYEYGTSSTIANGFSGVVLSGGSFR